MPVPQEGSICTLDQVLVFPSNAYTSFPHSALSAVLKVDQHIVLKCL